MLPRPKHRTMWAQLWLLCGPVAIGDLTRGKMGESEGRARLQSVHLKDRGPGLARFSGSSFLLPGQGLRAYPVVRVRLDYSGVPVWSKKMGSAFFIG